MENLTSELKKINVKGVTAFPVMSALPMPPIELECPASYYEESSSWMSQMFASSAGFLQVKVNFVRRKLNEIFVVKLETYDCPRVKVTIKLKNLQRSCSDWTFHREAISDDLAVRADYSSYLDPKKYVGNSRLLFHVTGIRYV